MAKKRRIKTGLYTSNKTGKTCKYKSGWELAYMQYLDMCPAVISWEYEAIGIKYLSNKSKGIIRIYFPDFLVHFSDKNYIIEIKPARKVNQLKNQKKFKSAIEYCKLNDFQFQIVTEKELKILGLI